MQVLNIFHVLVAIALIAFVLVQRGAGATAGAAFGSGASGTVFGARGAGSFLSRTTWWLGVAFFAISLTMAMIASRSIGNVDDGGSVVDQIQTTEQVLTEPATDIPVVPQATEASSDVPAVDALPTAEQVVDDAAADEGGTDR